jgi:hypothetical protein
MRTYLLQFTVESCLTKTTDVTINHDGVDVTFLFSKRQPADKHVRTHMKLEAANSREAQGKASTDVLPPLLDALTFTTGTPLLLVECELILKDEHGSVSRRAIYVGHKASPTKIALTDEAVAEAAKVLNVESLKLPVCWHRYALHRQLTLDRFIFNWLSLEALAGDADIPSRCPKCHKELECCGLPISHRGSSKTRAAEIFHAANSAVSVGEFNSKIWNTARNKVFHGRSYPSPAYLGELASTSELLRKSAEGRIAEVAGTPGQKPYYRYEDLYRVFFFVEWNTSTPEQEFAADWPQAVLASRAAKAELNQVFMEATPENVTFLDYKHSAAW